MCHGFLSRMELLKIMLSNDVPFNILFREFARAIAIFHFREIETYCFWEIEICHFGENTLP